MRPLCVSLRGRRSTLWQEVSPESYQACGAIHAGNFPCIRCSCVIPCVTVGATEALAAFLVFPNPVINTPERLLAFPIPGVGEGENVEQAIHRTERKSIGLPVVEQDVFRPQLQRSLS